MARLESAYPPCQSGDPYVHLCFSAADEARAGEFLAALRERGVRVWYARGKTADKSTLAARQERANNASLLVLMTSNAARNDRGLKGTALFQLSRGKPVVCVDLDRDISALSMGLPADLPHIDAWRMPSMHAAEEELLHCTGFSYDLIGEPAAPATKTSGRALTLVLLALAALLVTVGFAGARLGWFVDDGLHAGDTLALESPELIVAARAALEGGSITPESVATIRVLRLSELPENLSELDAFTGLERLEIPQDQAGRATELLDNDRIRIVLVG